MAERRPRVKVCGVTTPGDAVLAVRLGADFLGLNFYPPSPRALAPAAAAAIAAAARAAAPAVRIVGVFVGASRAAIEAGDAAGGLDLVQFHGDEPAAALRPFAARAIKVFRVSGRLEPAVVAPYLESGVWGFLFDTHDRRYGGSGRGWRFETLRELASDRPVLIAGGLGPDNVGAAVAAAAPWGIDVCSGVESSPGHKDPARLRRLFEEIDHGADRQAAAAS